MPVDSGADTVTNGSAGVGGADLLAAIRGFITTYMVLPSEEVADFLALWILHTWCIDGAFATPYLRITSATPDSGKTASSGDSGRSVPV
jgi:hypothetical protein